MVNSRGELVAVVDDGGFDVVVTVAECGGAVEVVPRRPAVERGDEHAVTPIDTVRRTRANLVRGRRREWRTSTAQTVVWPSWTPKRMAAGGSILMTRQWVRI